MQGLCKQASLWLLLVSTAAVAESGPNYKVVVHPAVPTASISRRELRAIFLREKTEWIRSVSAVPVDQIETSAVREAFSKDIHGRGAAAVKAYWLQIVFSGRGAPPIERASDQEVIDYVKAKPGAIGYVSAAAQTDDVKSLRVEP